MLSKINVLKIVSDHFATLSWRKDSYFLFIPFLFSVICVACGFTIDKDMVDIINTGLSIFVGLFFNVVVLIFDLIKKTDDEVKKKVLKQTITNICFIIFVAIVGILIAYMVITFSQYPICFWLISFFLYFVISFFFLTILMILKRIYYLFIVESNEI